MVYTALQIIIRGSERPQDKWLKAAWRTAPCRYGRSPPASVRPAFCPQRDTTLYFSHRVLGLLVSYWRWAWECSGHVTLSVWTTKHHPLSLHSATVPSERESTGTGPNTGVNQQLNPVPRRACSRRRLCGLDGSELQKELVEQIQVTLRGRATAGKVALLEALIRRASSGSRFSTREAVEQPERPLGRREVSG